MIEGSEIVPISLQAASRRMQAHPGRPALAASVAAVIFLISAPMPLRAAGTELIGGTVSPGQGTTATSFVFVVDYASSPARDALSVRAEVVDADMTLDLALVGGNAAGGTWRASSALPVGTWTIIFKADAAIGLDPTLTVSDAVVVTQATSPPTSPPASPPSPPPTQAPTARPSPRTSPQPRPTVPATSPPSDPAPQPSVPPGATATSPGWVAPIASSTAGTPRAGATPVSIVTASPSATAGASLTASPVVAARPDAASPGATPGAEPADAATPAPEAADATSAGASIGRNAWLLLGGSLTVLGSAVLARQWLRRRPGPGSER